jgi:hypothetical protein
VAAGASKTAGHACSVWPSTPEGEAAAAGCPESSPCSNTSGRDLATLPPGAGASWPQHARWQQLTKHARAFNGAGVAASTCLHVAAEGSDADARMPPVMKMPDSCIAADDVAVVHFTDSTGERGGAQDNDAHDASRCAALRF